MTGGGGGGYLLEQGGKEGRDKDAGMIMEVGLERNDGRKG